MVSGSGRTDAQQTETLIAKGVVFTIVGTCLLIGAALYAQSTREFLRTSVVVPGRVIKLNAARIIRRSRSRRSRASTSNTRRAARSAWRRARRSRCATHPMRPI